MVILLLGFVESNRFCCIRVLKVKARSMERAFFLLEI